MTEPSQKRRQFWIDAPLQLQMLVYGLLLVTASLLLVSVSVHRGLHQASIDSRHICHSLEWIDDAVRPPLLLGAAISILVSALATIVWSHRLAGPLRILSSAIHRMAKGNLSGAVRVRDSDALQEFVEEFSAMQEALRRMVQNDRKRVEDVCSQLDELAKDLENDRNAQEEVLKIIGDIKAIGADYRV